MAKTSLRKEKLLLRRKKEENIFKMEKLTAFSKRDLFSFKRFCLISNYQNRKEKKKKR